MRARAAMLGLLLLAAMGCGGPKGEPVEALPSRPVGKPVTIAIPKGLPPLPAAADNPPTAETIALGEKLFFSPLLSVDGTVSCASCHNPAKGFADGRAVSTGVGGKQGNRNAPSVVNAAYNTTQFWDGRAASLEEQAQGPMLNGLEMAHTIEGVETKLAGDAEMRRMFEAAFGAGAGARGPVTMERVKRAIAAYERTLLRGNSAFDRYQFGGDEKALGAAARRGLAVFKDPKKGNCAVCHTIESDHALFTDQKFHNLGAGMNAEGELTDAGRFAVTKREEDRAAFRTPGLRNVAETAPYMHDGSLKTLKDVVDFYVGGGNSNPQRDREIKPLTHLTKQEREDLVAFLESLTGEAAK